MSSNVFTTFNSEVEKRHQEMINDLESISVGDLKNEGLQISIGGRTYKFTDLEVVENKDLEEKLRREFKEKLNSQQQRIREKINQKINQLLLMHQQKQQEMDRKEAAMKRRYQDAAMMPDIKESHMLKGLSVVKGNSNDELIWIYRAVYNPRFIVYYDENSYSRNERNKHRKIIPDRLINRMKKDILLIISTKKDTVTGVKTKELNTDGTGRLPNFNHYHQTGNGDCWGNWKHDTKWNSPDDILSIAKEAEAVLETINQGSIASRGPSGLPRLDTILKNVEDSPEASLERNRSAENNNDEDVWSV